jgi:hypothetical protein
MHELTIEAYLELFEVHGGTAKFGSEVAELRTMVRRISSRPQLANTRPSLSSIARASTATVWRAALVERLASDAELQCRSQELVNWCSPYLTDCFSVITRRGSRWSRPNVVVKNRKFMRAAADITARGRLYS